MAINVDSAESPICSPIIRGSNVRRSVNNIPAKIANFIPVDGSAEMKLNNAQGPKMTMEPIIGIKSMIQMRVAMSSAFLGDIINSPI